MSNLFEILNALGFSLHKNFLSARPSSRHRERPYISVRAPRGQGFAADPTAVIFDCDGSTGLRGRVHASTSLRLKANDPAFAEKFSTWLAKEAIPLHEKRAKLESEFNAKREALHASIAEYRAAVAKLTGACFTVNHDTERAVGIALTVNIQGTPEEVGRKLELIKAIK